MVDWLNDNQGAAIVLLTLVLVVATIWYAWTTQRALRLGRDQHELERRLRRGANVLIRFDKGTRFKVWVRGPSDAQQVRLWLQVGDWRGPERTVLVSEISHQPYTYHYSISTQQVEVPAGVDGSLGVLAGECMNEHAELEPIRSAPFFVRVPDTEQGNQVTFDRTT